MEIKPMKSLANLPRVRSTLPLVIAVLLSGCTSLSEYIHNGLKVGPNYSQPPAAVAPRWIDDADKRVRKDSDDLSQWWKVFNDPELDSLICHAYKQNITLREAGFRVLQARALRGVAVGELFPQAQSVTGNYTRSLSSLDALTNSPFISSVAPGFGPATSINRYLSTWNTNFGLAWELDFWGRFRRAVEAADADLDASVEGYNDVLVTLLGDVATNYTQFRVLQEQIRLLNENVRLQNETLKIAQARFDVGKTTELDPAQAKSTVEQTIAQIAQTKTQLRRTTNRLCVLLGMPPEELESRLAKSNIPEAPKEAAAGIPADLLRRRPDVRRAERQAAAESARIGVAQADFYPHISINGSLGWQAPKPQQLFTPAAFQASYGPSFQWDVLNYGRILNKVRYQRAKFEEVVATYQNKVLSAAEEVENGMTTFLNAHEQVEHLAKSVLEAKKARDIGFLEFEKGKVDFIRVSILEQTLVQQQNLLAQARGDVALGLIQVYRAAGGGWDVRTACGESCNVNPLAALGDRTKTGEAQLSLDMRGSLGQPLVLTPTEK
jgi:NodT family efflux transporter outer membrane factor (OMF) lipoprotein